MSRTEAGEVVILSRSEIQESLEVYRELNNPLVTSLLDLQREEVEQRVAFKTYWESDREAAERNFGALPDPRLDFAFAFQRDKERLLETKYEGLVTRGFLREERWLEFTYIRLGELCQEQGIYRACVEAEEQQRSCNLTVQQLRLAALTVHGTEGSVVRIEELEREVRYRVLYFEEVVVREVVQSECEVSFQAAHVRERKRFERYRQSQVEIRDEEIPARWDIEGAEIPERRALEILKIRTDKTVFGQLEWRFINLEVNTRYDIEYLERDTLAEEILELPEYQQLMASLEDSLLPSHHHPTSEAARRSSGGSRRSGALCEETASSEEWRADEVGTSAEMVNQPDEGDDAASSVLALAVEMDDQSRRYSPDQWQRKVQDAMALEMDGDARYIGVGGALPSPDYAAPRRSVDSEIPDGSNDSSSTPSTQAEIQAPAVCAIIPKGEPSIATTTLDDDDDDDGGPTPNLHELNAMWAELDA